MAVLLFFWFSYPIRIERECPAKNALTRRNAGSGARNGLGSHKLKVSAQKSHWRANAQISGDNGSRSMEGMPRLEKSTNEWVERQFEPAGSRSNYDKWSS
jgi:hypothetical protein